MLRRALAIGRYLLWWSLTAAACSLVLFGAFEAFPQLLDIVDLRSIRYYKVKARYVPDPVLVFVPRNQVPLLEGEERSLRYVFNGDLYRPGYGAEPLGIQYTATYNHHGFRSNSSEPPFDAIVMGDSYIEIGETDRDTLSEMLARKSGLSTFNLGRAWYGPDQYIELFKRYGMDLKPKYALFGYFDGNDLKNIRDYLQWLDTGDYKHFPIGQGFFARYAVAMSGIWSQLRTSTMQLIDGARTGGEEQNPGGLDRVDIGMIALGDQEIRMRFAYWNPLIGTETLMKSPEVRRLRTLLREFRDLAQDQGITPVFLYIPTKFQVYGERFTARSGRKFQNRIGAQLRTQTNRLYVVRKVAESLEIPFIDLLPPFKARAARGELLYYPFDSHWNPAGRQVAAQVTAARLGMLERTTRAGASPGG